MLSRKTKRAELERKISLLKSDVEHYLKMVEFAANKDSGPCKEWKRKLTEKQAELVEVEEELKLHVSDVILSDTVMMTPDQEAKYAAWWANYIAERKNNERGRS